MKTLIIIPAFNEQDNIDKLLDELTQDYPQYDYVVINDCSTDNTANILKNRKANYINLPTNLGIGGGVQTGYLYAYQNGYDIAVQMDGDGQHLPEYLANIIEPIEKGQADAVVGSRFINNEGFQSSFMRRLGIVILSTIIKMLTGMKITDVTSGFRAVNRKGIELFASNYAQDYPEPEALVVSALHGIKTIEVPVVMQERLGGKSSINGFKSAYYMIKVSLALIFARITTKRRKA
ncbi:MAG: glycosyltransferase family 2 protein [Clostridia bacterium]|nr:glycosyltransferase family 2 protein [Clostridia bacterium]